MTAPDPNNEEERAAHIANVLAAIPDYSRAGKKPPPVERPRFPEILAPACTMSEEQIAELQVQDCMNEVDFIKTPAHVADCLRHTYLHDATYHQIVRYAWDRLRDQQRDIQDAEFLLDQLGLEGSERGYGRKGEAYLQRAQHVGDEDWLATATTEEMKDEVELASNERLEMELSEANLINTAELEMEANRFWGDGPFDRASRPPVVVIPYHSPTTSEDEQCANNHKLNAGRRGGNRRGGRGNGNGKHEGTGRGGPSNGCNTNATRNNGKRALNVDNWRGNKDNGNPDGNRNANRNAKRGGHRGRGNARDS